MDINLKKYSGKWFEIARIQSDFELNMKNVTAQYNLNENGTIEVINSGYVNDKLEQIFGIAIPAIEKDLLLVSFFPYSYSNYQILFIDDNYNYAVVGGDSKDYLWILSRTPNINNDMLNKLIGVAKKNNYNIDKITLTEQTV